MAQLREQNVEGFRAPLSNVKAENRELRRILSGNWIELQCIFSITLMRMAIKSILLRKNLHLVWQHNQRIQLASLQMTSIQGREFF
ncbi:hypothetical protein Ancab_022455 [Ancistrocladus abbreviatus]